jgi:hypothetical protein
MTSEPRLIRSQLADHFFIEPPPRDFNLLRASPDELHQFGLPHRPDAKLFPAAARAWTSVMRRVKRFITPELVTRRDIIHGPIRGLQRIARPGGTVLGASGWSGLVVNDLPPYLSVWGSWNIPEVQVPPNPPNDVNSFFSSTWVGLGGFGNNNLLQAGTDQNVSVGENPTYSAWIEWFPAPPNTVGGFPVAVGQTIAVFVGALGDFTGRGLVGMANLETGDATPMMIIPIPTIDFNGNTITPVITGPSGASAEWIVERPSTVQNKQLVLLEAADFGEVNFTHAAAQSAGAGGAKTETIAAATDSNAIAVQMIGDDNVTVLAEETNTWALQVTFQQTASVQSQEEEPTA